MLVQERHKRIVELINDRGSVSVAFLSDALNTSEVTVRKDLEFLHRQNIIIRTRGGAMAPSYPPRVEKYHELYVICQKEKKSIAEAAFQVIRDGDSLLLDGSTTVMELVKLIAQSRYRLDIYTTSLKVCNHLISSEGDFTVHILGGKVNKDMGTTEGMFTADELSTLSVRRSFFGINGINHSGYSVAREEEAMIKRGLCTAAKESYLLADSTKFGRRYLVKAIDISDSPTYIISDSRKADFDYSMLEKHTCLVFCDETPRA